MAACVAAVQGVASTSPRRSLAATSTTQSAILLFGLVAPEATGLLGATVQWVGLGIALVGLGGLIESIEGRVGAARSESVRGLLGPAPGLALAFLLFAATLSGFPGTIGFAGEDLVIQSAVAEGSRWLLLVATALNGATMLRLFALLFLGPLPAEARGFPALTSRERLVTGALGVALVVATLRPALLGGAP